MKEPAATTEPAAKKEAAAKKEPVAAVKKETAQASCRRRQSPPPLACHILCSACTLIRPLLYPTPSGARIQARSGEASSQQKDGAGAPTLRT